MSMMQEKAYEMIKRLPDDMVYYMEQKAYEDLQQLRKCSDVDIDYKEELSQALEEKYAGIGSVKILSALQNKDFSTSEIPAIMPDEFLEKLLKR